MKIDEIRKNKIDADRLTVQDMVDSAIDDSETYNDAIKLVNQELPSGRKTSRTLLSVYESFSGLQQTAQRVIRRLARKRGIDPDSLQLERIADVEYKKIPNDDSYYHRYQQDFIQQTYSIANDALVKCRTYEKALEYIDEAWDMVNAGYGMNLQEKQFKEIIDLAKRWINQIAMQQEIHDSEGSSLKKQGKKLIDKEFNYD